MSTRADVIAAVAEDIVQDCFMALWRKPAAYDASRGKMRAFLLGIARNLVLKRWRDERPHERLDDEAFVCMPLDVALQERAEAVGEVGAVTGDDHVVEQ